MQEKNAWEKIWSNRNIKSDVNLKNAIIASGYDNPQSVLKESSLLKEIESIEIKNAIIPTDSIFEVGCGSGSFLYYLHQKGYKVGGIDFSANLIEYANRLIPAGQWSVSQAINVDVVEKWDHVISNGVFLYFPDLAYAQQVVGQMIKKANKCVAIYDIPDLASKDEVEKIRLSLNGDDYKEKYKGLDHLYYAKDWWESIAKNSGKTIEFFDRNVEGYINSSYRYNVLIRI